MSSDSEEEVIMVVDLQGIIESDWTNRIGNKCKMIGIDTDEPVLQLDHYIFRGHYEDVAGTMALFEEDENSADDSDDDDDETFLGEEKKQKYKYKFCTHKRLAMQRAFLTEKESKTENEDQQASTSTSQPNRQSVTSDVQMDTQDSTCSDTPQSTSESNTSQNPAISTAISEQMEISKSKDNSHSKIPNKTSGGNSSAT